MYMLIYAVFELVDVPARNVHARQRRTPETSYRVSSGFLYKMILCVKRTFGVCVET